MRLHGKKYYYQVLLDTGRGELLNHLAGDKKVVHYIRDILYDHIQKRVPKEVYDEALQQDLRTQHESTINRVGSRILNALQQPKGDGPT